jgi:hypothetical protein
MAQSNRGKVELFNDFFGVQNILALTGDPAAGAGAQLGEFILGGEGIEDGDSGIVGKDALSGVVTITSADVNADTAFIGTHIGFDVGLMGTIVLETRVQMAALTAREIFFGLTSILTLDEQLEDIVINASATTLVMPADLCAFYLSDELTTVAGDWHAIHNGGSATATTTTTGDAQLNNVAVVGEWQVLRLEIDNNGTARWYIDGVLKQTVVGAVSTTTDFAMCLAVGSNAGTVAALDCDYLLVQANRDWTA